MLAKFYKNTKRINFLVFITIKCKNQKNHHCLLITKTKIKLITINYLRHSYRTLYYLYYIPNYYCHS